MPVITINGQMGSGAPEIGAQIAQLLKIDYVDRMIIARAANRLGATVEAVAEREQKPLTRTDRIARFLQGHWSALPPREPVVTPTSGQSWGQCLDRNTGSYHASRSREPTNWTIRSS